MSFKKIIVLTIIALLLHLGVISESKAASVGVWCQVRGLERSKVKVTGRGLRRGKYFAKILSGGVWMKTWNKPTLNRQVEFEFDSHTDEGPWVTVIPPTFIQGLTVLGLIRDAKTKRLIGKFSSDCEYRDD